MQEQERSEFLNNVVAAADRIEYEDMMVSSRRAQDFGGPPMVDDESAEARAKAASLLREKTVLDTLCPALRSVSDDLSSIAKVVGGSMLTLALSPAAAIPVSALVFGAIAVMIARAGVSSLCAGHEAKPKTE